MWDNPNILIVLIEKFQVLCFGKKSAILVVREVSVPSFIEPFALWVRVLLAQAWIPLLRSSRGPAIRETVPFISIVFLILTGIWLPQHTTVIRLLDSLLALIASIAGLCLTQEREVNAHTHSPTSSRESSQAFLSA